MKVTQDIVVNGPVYADVPAPVFKPGPAGTHITIRGLTKYDPKATNGILFGDPTVQRVQVGLRQALTGTVAGLPSGLRSLADVGLTFGAVGAAVGATQDLVFNAAKFQAAVTADSDAVAQLFSTFAAAAGLDAGGTGSLASISGTPTVLKLAGRYAIASDTLGNVQATFQGVDGSAPQVTTGTISAGGTNTTLIPGLTLTAKGVLVSGTDYISVTATKQGFAKTLAEYVSSLSRSGGLITNSTDEMARTISNMSASIDRMNARLTAQQQMLVTKFSNMEQSISRLQGQGQALTQMATQLGNINRR